MSVPTLPTEMWNMIASNGPILKTVSQTIKDIDVKHISALKIQTQWKKQYAGRICDMRKGDEVLIKNRFTKQLFKGIVHYNTHQICCSIITYKRVYIFFSLKNTEAVSMFYIKKIKKL